MAQASTPEPSRHDRIRLDALREVGTIGAGHATTALAKMTGRRVMIDVPAASIVDVSEIAGILQLDGQVVAVVSLRVMGDITGHALFVLPESNAVKLSEILLGKKSESSGELNLMERSSIEEAGNVVASAYLNALSDFLGVMSMPSVPLLAVGDSAEILDTALRTVSGASEIVVCITTRFVFEESVDGLAGHYIFLPDRPALRAILAALQLD